MILSSYKIQMHSSSIFGPLAIVIPIFGAIMVKERESHDEEGKEMDYRITNG